MADSFLAQLRSFIPPEPDTTMSAALLPRQKQLFLAVDTSWPYYRAWKALSPIGAQLNFTYTDLDNGIEEAASVNYQDTQILGRAENFKTYVGTSNREVRFVFQFRASGLEGDDLYSAIDKEVTQPMRWLDSLRNPFQDSQGDSHAPPPLILVVGQFLVMRCVLTEATPRAMPAWDTDTHLPMAGEVSCCFCATHKNLGNYQYTGPSRWAGFQSPFTTFGPAK